MLALVSVAAGFGVSVARLMDGGAVFWTGSPRSDPPPDVSLALIAAGASAVALVAAALLAGTGALSRSGSAGNRRRGGR